MVIVTRLHQGYNPPSFVLWSVMSVMGKAVKACYETWYGDNSLAISELTDSPR